MSESRPPRESASPRGLFPTTRWTVVRTLSSEVPTFRIVAWENFCTTYWRPLHTWLRLRGVPHETAEDLVQSFFAKLHASPVPISQLHPAHGKLRSYLLSALRNFWIDHQRSHRQEALHTTPAPGHEPAHEGENADLEFDHAWATALLTRAVSLLREEYEARGNGNVFAALLPLIENDDSAARENTARLTGLSGNTFNVALKRLRERLAARLRAEVAMTVSSADDAEIDAELRHLITVIGRFGFAGSLAAHDPGAVT